MAHDVTFTTPVQTLGKADVVFTVYKDDNKLGNLHVSNGSIVWFPFGTTYGHRMQWGKFDELMRDALSDSESR